MSLRLAAAIEENEGSVFVAENLGRCTKFNIYELDKNGEILNTVSLFNPLEGDNKCAGQLPGYINQYNVHTIITGYIEQKVITKFMMYNIKVIIAPGLLIDEALNLFIKGKLKKVEVKLIEINKA